MSAHRLVLAAAFGSFALLGAALVSQYFGGLHPCKMCIWQRWPHGAAIGFGALFLLTSWRPAILLGALCALVTSGIGAFHAGVEQGWWEGPTTCSSGDISGLSTEDLLDQILTAPVVRCDEIVWEFAGISMAGWNALLSAGLVLIWLWGWRAYASSSASQ